jgi:hypothetical protein
MACGVCARLNRAARAAHVSRQRMHPTNLDAHRQAIVGPLTR